MSYIVYIVIVQEQADSTKFHLFQAAYMCQLILAFLVAD